MGEIAATAEELLQRASGRGEHVGRKGCRHPRGQ